MDPGPEQHHLGRYLPPAKHWSFCINNPTAWLDHLATEKDVSYAVFQLESGTKGTPHWQGYLQLNTKLRLPQVKVILQSTDCHLEKCKGTPTQNRTYCTKEDSRLSADFWEIGEFQEKGKGRRSDLKALHSCLQQGLEQHEYADHFFKLFVRYPHLLTNYNAAQSRPRTGNFFRATLLFGKARTGKSTLARQLADGMATILGQHGRVFRKQPGKWWDGYNRERVVVFDDFRGSSLSYTDFKLTIDSFPLRVEVKGTYHQLEATHFFITSNFDPKDWWTEEVTSPDRSAIFLRFQEVYFFETLGRYRHYASYQAYVHDYGTIRKEMDPFVIQTELQTISSQCIQEIRWQSEAWALQTQNPGPEFQEPRHAEDASHQMVNQEPNGG